MGEALIERLKAIANHRPRYGQPKDVESVDLALYSALRRFLVDYPKGNGLDEEQLTAIRDILHFFGQPGDTDSQRLESLEKAIIAAAPRNGQWSALFEHHKGIGDRIVASGVAKRRSANGKAPDYPQAQHRYVHEMAWLIAEAVEARLAMSVDEVQARHDPQRATLEPTHQLFATITVQLFTRADSLTEYDVQLDGTVGDWYLQIADAKFGVEQFPATEVKVVTKPGADPESEVRKQFASMMQDTFLSSAEVAIPEMCRLAIQYCSYYFDKPLLMKALIEAILSRAWTERSPEDDAYFAVYRGEGLSISIPLYLPTSHLRTLAAFHSQELEIDFTADNLEWVSEVGRDRLVKIALPAIISEWMGRRARSEIISTEHIETFLNPGYWQLVRGIEHPLRP